MFFLNMTSFPGPIHVEVPSESVSLPMILIQMAISRSREYKADAGAASITGNPYGLASALKKLKSAGERRPMKASRNTAHLFIYQPFLGSLGNLFSTHPPIDERVRRLTEK